MDSPVPGSARASKQSPTETNTRATNAVPVVKRISINSQVGIQTLNEKIVKQLSAKKSSAGAQLKNKLHGSSMDLYVDSARMNVPEKIEDWKLK